MSPGTQSYASLPDIAVGVSLARRTWGDAFLTLRQNTDKQCPNLVTLYDAEGNTHKWDISVLVSISWLDSFHFVLRY